MRPWISLIAAVGVQGQLGLEGKLPWHIPGDLQLFKRKTYGHPLIMGRRTFESLKRPLPGRPHFVLSRQAGLVFGPQVVVCENLSAALEQACQLESAKDDPEVFISGGAEIYRQALAVADRLYLTRVEYEGPADAFFPALSWPQWQEDEGQKCAGESPQGLKWEFHFYGRQKFEETKL